MISQQQYKRFGRVKAGYCSINAPKKQNKPTNGSLWLDGYLHLYNLPFALLQAKKMDLIRKGYTSKRIRIGYNDK